MARFLSMNRTRNSGYYKTVLLWNHCWFAWAAAVFGPLVVGVIIKITTGDSIFLQHGIWTLVTAIFVWYALMSDGLYMWNSFSVWEERGLSLGYALWYVANYKMLTVFQREYLLEPMIWGGVLGISSYAVFYIAKVVNDFAIRRR